MDVIRRTPRNGIGDSGGGGAGGGIGDNGGGDVSGGIGDSGGGDVHVVQKVLYVWPRTTCVLTL